MVATANALVVSIAIRGMRMMWGSPESGGSERLTNWNYKVLIGLSRTGSRKRQMRRPGREPRSRRVRQLPNAVRLDVQNPELSLAATVGREHQVPCVGCP